MSEVARRDEVRWDLVECSTYLEARNLDAGERFLVEAEAAFRRLAAQPGLGEPCGFREPRFADVRRSRISRFKNFLIYYRPIEGGIEVLRVVHGARDQSAILDLEAGD